MWYNIYVTKLLHIVYSFFKVSFVLTLTLVVFYYLEVFSEAFAEAIV